MDNTSNIDDVLNFDAISWDVSADSTVSAEDVLISVKKIMIELKEKNLEIYLTMDYEIVASISLDMPPEEKDSVYMLPFGTKILNNKLLNKIVKDKVIEDVMISMKEIKEKFLENEFELSYISDQLSVGRL